MTATSPTRTGRGTHRIQREHVARLHSYLTRYGLVTWTSGNVSERVPGEDLFVIKGSGVEYDELEWQGITVCDLEGNVVVSQDAQSGAFDVAILPGAQRPEESKQAGQAET